MISMDGRGALRNNEHPSRGHNGRLNGAQAGGDTAQCSGPFPSLTFRRGGGGGRGDATPMRRLLSPGVSERCSSTASGQGRGSEGTPVWPMGSTGKTQT